MRWLYLLAVATGCSFEHGQSGTRTVSDAGEEGSGSAMPGAEPTQCVAGFLDLCGQAPPSMSLDVSAPSTINTDTDPRCRTLTQSNGGPICLIYVTSVGIGAGATLSATGSRPLAIASTSTMGIAGIIDVASRRADNKTGPAASGTCAFSASPEADLGGAGGGAGGGFGAVGGNGGRGDSDTSQGGDGDAAPGLAGPTLTPMVLRGGCRGQAGGNESAGGGAGGTGGHSGGALYLYAATSIAISGSIRASGAGGNGGAVQAGGGGGGSGGMVVVESPTISGPGTIAANGGGGGEGGARVGMSSVRGQPGDDGAATSDPANGGVGDDNRFGYGGDGGAGATAAEAGTTSIVSGGGGGGGVGIIKLIGAATLTGTVTPPAS